MVLGHQTINSDLRTFPWIGSIKQTKQNQASDKVNNYNTARNTGSAHRSSFIALIARSKEHRGGVGMIDDFRTSDAHGIFGISDIACRRNIATNNPKNKPRTDLLPI